MIKNNSRYISVLILVFLISNASGSDIYVFATGSDNSMWYNQLDGSSWRGWQSLGGIVSYDPEAFILGSDLYAFVRGSDKALWYRKLTDSTWGQWQGLGGIMIANPEVARFDSDLYAFVRGSDNTLWYRKLSNLTWTSWTNLGGNITSDPEAVQNYVFVRGIDLGMWYRRLESNAFIEWANLGGSIESNPGVVPYYVFARGGDNGIWYNKRNGSFWSGWESLGGIVSSEPEIIILGSEIYIFVRGSDNALWLKKLEGGIWKEWKSLGGILASKPNAILSGSDIYIFVRGSDNSLWYKKLRGNLWSEWESLGGQIVFSPAAISGVHATIAYIGDPEIYDFPDGIYELTKDLNQIIPQSPTDTLDAVIFLGDMKNFSHARAAYLNSSVKSIPAFYVIGNHEAESSFDMTDIKNANMNSIISLNPGPYGTEKTTYSFNIGNFHIVNLNEYWDGAGNDAWFEYGTDGGYIPNNLYNWMEDDLSGTQNTWKIVLGHEPLYPERNHVGNSLDKNVTNRDKLQNLFVAQNVSLFIGGHTHYAGVQLKDGVYHAAVGVTGTATLKGEDPFASIFYTHTDIDNNLVLTWKRENPDWATPNTTSYTIRK